MCVCAHVCVLRHCTSLLCLQLSCFVSDNFIFELLIGHKPRPYRKYGSVDAQLPFTDLDFSKCCWEPQPQYLWTYSKEFVVVIVNYKCQLLYRVSQWQAKLFSEVALTELFQFTSCYCRLAACRWLTLAQQLTCGQVMSSIILYYALYIIYTYTQYIVLLALLAS